MVSQEFNGVIEPLMKRHVPGTRERLLREFDNWHDNPTADELSEQQSRAFVLVAGPGVGKSAFSAMLCKLRDSAITAHHFCCWGDSEKASPSRMLCSLAFQLAQKLFLPTTLEDREYRQRIENLTSQQLEGMSLIALFNKLLLEPLSAVNVSSVRGGQAILLIDGLDEASAAGGRNELLRLICSRFQDLPEWVRFVITTRPTDDREDVPEAQRDLLRHLKQFKPHKIEVRVACHSLAVCDCKRDHIILGLEVLCYQENFV